MTKDLNDEPHWDEIEEEQEPPYHVDFLGRKARIELAFINDEIDAEEYRRRLHGLGIKVP